MLHLTTLPFHTDKLAECRVCPTCQKSYWFQKLEYWDLNVPVTRTLYRLMVQNPDKIRQKLSAEEFASAVFRELGDQDVMLCHDFNPMTWELKTTPDSRDLPLSVANKSNKKSNPEFVDEFI